MVQDYHAILKPLVIDADALNAIADFSEMLAKIKSFAIITPHFGEFYRLFNVDCNCKNDELSIILQDIANKLGITVLLKGPKTVITSKDQISYSETGNPGLATGGSGDVLTGLIAAVLAQVKDPHKAALWAAYLHGLAADIAAEDLTQIALTPSDVLDYLPRTYKLCGVK